MVTKMISAAGSRFSFGPFAWLIVMAELNQQIVGLRVETLLPPTFGSITPRAAATFRQIDAFCLATQQFRKSSAPTCIVCDCRITCEHNSNRLAGAIGFVRRHLLQTTRVYQDIKQAGRSSKVLSFLDAHMVVGRPPSAVRSSNGRRRGRHPTLSSARSALSSPEIMSRCNCDICERES